MPKLHPASARNDAVVFYRFIQYQFKFKDSAVAFKSRADEKRIVINPCFY